MVEEIFGRDLQIGDIINYCNSPRMMEYGIITALVPRIEYHRNIPNRWSGYYESIHVMQLPILVHPDQGGDVREHRKWKIMPFTVWNKDVRFVALEQMMTSVRIDDMDKARIMQIVTEIKAGTYVHGKRRKQ